MLAANNPAMLQSPRERGDTAMQMTKLCKAWLQEKQALRGWTVATVQAYESDVRCFVAFVKKDALREFRVQQVKDWAIHMHTEGYMADGIRRRLAALSSFGDWLVKRGDIQTNPLTMIDRPSKQDRLPRPAEPRHVDAMEAIAGPRDLALVRLMRYGGLRDGEVISLDIEFVDMTFGAVILQRTKGKRDRAIPMLPPLQAALAAWLAERGQEPGPLFVGQRAKRLSRKAIGRILDTLTRVARVPRIVPHQLRHTFGTEQLRNGLQLHEVQALMGHKSPLTTQLYTRITQEDLAASMRKAWERKQ